MMKNYFSNYLRGLVAVAIMFLLTGCGSGFVDSEQSLGTDDSRSLAMGDIDADGDLDMVVANQNQANLVYLNDGLGNFGTSFILSSDTNDTTAVALAAWNPDAAPAPRGEFDPASGEFRFDASTRQRPARPWINVLSNAGFGGRSGCGARRPPRDPRGRGPSHAAVAGCPRRIRGRPRRGARRCEAGEP